MNINLEVDNKYREESVKISLYFSGNDIPFDKITSILEVDPTYIRTKSDWSEQEFSSDEWVFELKKWKEINQAYVEDVFEELIGIFGDKTDRINRI